MTCGKCAKLIEQLGVVLCAALGLTAMAMAIEDSVTVSMGDEIRGVFKVIFFVNADVRSSNCVDLEANTSSYDLKIIMFILFIQGI